MSRNLDVLRAIAVLAVFIAHLGLSVGGHLIANMSARLEAVGRFGVLIFFLHTSLVLMCSMERSRAEAGFAIRFYVRRAFRIYPLAIVAVLTTYFMQLPPNAWSHLDFMPVSMLQLGANLLLVQNIAREPSVLTVLWSLPLEVQMYVVLPALFVFVDTGTWRIRLGLTYLLGGVGALVVWSLTGKLNLFAFIPCFLSGILAFKRIKCQRTLPGLMWLVLILSSLVGLAICPLYQRHYCKPIGIAFEWIAVFVLGYSWPMFREIKSDRLATAAHLIAKYSYGIYLFHTIALYFVFVSLRTTLLLGTIMAVVLTSALAVLGYYLIEEPMIGAGRRVAVRLGGGKMQAMSRRS